jgi:peroxiredoxin
MVIGNFITNCKKSNFKEKLMYNYPKFANKEYNLIHPQGIKVGEYLTNLTFHTLTGEKKALSDYTNKPIILETGSLTCGMFAAQSKKMNELANKYKDFNFLVLYVREAHPGNKVNAHNTFEEKCDLASRLQKEDQLENRTILIDDIEGTAHKILGSLPNMVFILNNELQMIFKYEWNFAKDLEAGISEYKQTLKPLPQKFKMLPLPNIKVEYKNFERAGWDALVDFTLTVPKLIITHLIGGFCGKYAKMC